ncbi:hypothetical protein CBW54_09355 [Yersinia kristensenii]|nr:hypothetical protein CBW54_09355 [Yersinia kristensenii]
MYSAENTVHHLLWCILIALRTAEQDKPFASETARRRFIAEWLDTARTNPNFRGMNAEFTTLRQLLENSDKAVPVDGTLSTLLDHAFAADHCDMFRFRSALNKLMQRGWRHVVCRFPENITTELIQRRQDRRKHMLQLTWTENVFRPTGDMMIPMTFQLLINSTRFTQEEAESVFHTEGFQVVPTDTELTLDKGRIVRTLHIGTSSLPASQWSPREIWQPSNDSAPQGKEPYH